MSMYDLIQLRVLCCVHSSRMLVYLDARLIRVTHA